MFKICLSAFLSLMFLVFARTNAPAGQIESKCDSKEAQLAVDNLIRVPLVRQATSYTCGVAALQSILAYYGDPCREDDLARALCTDPEQGTSYHRIAEYALAKGYTVKTSAGMTLADLKQQLDARKPVICLIQAWADRPLSYADDWDDGHYVVAVGYDKQSIYFMDPSTVGNYTQISISQFLERWHDRDLKERLVHFAMVITKADPTYNPAVILPLE